MFAYYTAAEDNRIVAMSFDGRTLGEPRVILDGIPKAQIHNGGRMVVGPDGLLYVGTGDSAESQLAQDRESLGGKILRITPDGKPAPDNPFGNEVFSMGHRNVQGLAFDEQDRLWACEFGSQEWDELNLIERGQQLRLATGRGVRRGRRSDQPQGGLGDRRGVAVGPGVLAGRAVDGRRSAASGSGRSRSTAPTPATRSPTSRGTTGGCARWSSPATDRACC